MRSRADPSGSGGLLVTNSSKRGERRAVGLLDLERGGRGGLRDVSADGPKVADGAVLFLRRVREVAGRNQVEQNVQDAAGLVQVEPRLDALALALLSGEEIAGARDARGPPRAGEKLLGRGRVERVLRLAAAMKAALLAHAPRPARLVVPDVEGA